MIIDETLHQSAVTLRPTMAINRSTRNASLRGLAASPNSAIPRTMAPAAPIPTQTAYAVPMGKVRAATLSNHQADDNPDGRENAGNEVS